MLIRHHFADPSSEFKGNLFLVNHGPPHFVDRFLEFISDQLFLKTKVLKKYFVCSWSILPTCLCSTTKDRQVPTMGTCNTAGQTGV